MKDNSGIKSEWTDSKIRLKSRQATRKGVEGFLSELRESPEVGIEPNYCDVRNKIIEQMVANEERGEFAREDLDTVTLLATEIEKLRELESELQMEFPELIIRINPIVQMIGFPGMVNTRKAELVIIDKRYEGELPEVSEIYKEEAIFESK